MFDWNDRAYRCPLRCMQCTGRTYDGRRCSRFSCYALPYCHQHLTRRGLAIRRSTVPGVNGNGLFARHRGPDAEGRTVFEADRMIVPYVGKKMSQAAIDNRYKDPEADGETGFRWERRRAKGFDKEDIDEEDIDEEEEQEEEDDSEEEEQEEEEELAPYAYTVNARGKVYVVTAACADRRLSECPRHTYHLPRPYVVDAACVRGAASLANSPHNTALRANARFAMVQEEGKAMRPWLVSTRRIKHGDEILVSYGPSYFRGREPRHRTYVPRPRQPLRQPRRSETEILRRAVR